MSALDEQIGGDHYKNLKIQPIEFCEINSIGFIESSVIKYLTRWKNKNGVEDLKKAVHNLQVLGELRLKGSLPDYSLDYQKYDYIGVYIAQNSIPLIEASVMVLLKDIRYDSTKLELAIQLLNKLIKEEEQNGNNR